MNVEEASARLTMAYEEHSTRLADAMRDGYLYRGCVVFGPLELFTRMFPGDSARRRMKRMQWAARHGYPPVLSVWRDPYWTLRRLFVVKLDDVSPDDKRVVDPSNVMVSSRYFTHVLSASFL